MKALVSRYRSRQWPRSNIGQESLLEQDHTIQVVVIANLFGAYVVLKSSDAVIASPEGLVAVNTSGFGALARAGAGDVLSGMIAALLAQQMDPWEALTAAVYIHGLAAELAPKGQRHLTADDLPGLIGDAMQEVSPFA